MSLLRLYVDHRSLGAGYRLVVLVRQDRRSATLVDFGTGTRFVVPADVLRTAEPIEARPKARFIAGLRANAKAFGHGGKTIAAAVAAIRGHRGPPTREIDPCS